MRVPCLLIVLLTAVPWMLGCQDGNKIQTNAPKLFTMAVDAVVQEREMFEPNLERLFNLRNMLIVVPTFFSHATFMAHELPRDRYDVWSQYMCPIVGYSCALLVQVIMKWKCHRDERIVNGLIIEKMRNMDEEGQEQFIDELSLANAQLFYDCFTPRSLRKCQKIADGFKDHAE